MKYYSLLTLIFSLCFNIAMGFNLPYTMSQNGIEQLKTHEGCVLSAYLDGGSYAIGYGHHSPYITANTTITLSEANAYLDDDVLWVNKELSLHIIPELFGNKNILIPQGLLDAIGDMIYRTGATTFKSSVVYARLKQCRISNSRIIDSDYRFVCAAIRTYETTSEGTIARQAHLADCAYIGLYFIRKINDKIYIEQ